MVPKAATALLVCFSLMAIANLVQADRPVLLAPGWLDTGEKLWQGPYEFIIQLDCNLVLYKDKIPIWASNTGGLSTICRFQLERDGYGVVWDRSNRVIWATGPPGPASTGAAFMILKCDGNVVISTSAGKAIWATGTSGRVEAINLEEDNRLPKPSNGSLISEVVPAANV